MTTIACNRSCMAGDRQYTTESNVKMVGGPKVFLLPTSASQLMLNSNSVAAGLAGSIRNISQAIEYFNGGKFPKLSGDFIGMFLTHDGKIYESYNLKYFFPITADYHAIGSGHKFALAALALGHSPDVAVHTAHQHDIYTGEFYDSVSP